MRHAHARPRADEDFLDGTPPALRAVPDDLTPEERATGSGSPSGATGASAPSRPMPAGVAPRPGDSGPRRGEAARPPVRRASLPAAVSVHGHAPAATTRAEAPAARGARPPRSAPNRARARPCRALPAASGAGPTWPRPPRTRRASDAVVRHRSGPDRLALWAVVLCLFMALVAAATARGDEPAPAEAAAPGAVAPRGAARRTAAPLADGRSASSGAGGRRRRSGGLRPRARTIIPGSPRVHG